LTFWCCGLPRCWNSFVLPVLDSDVMWFLDGFNGKCFLKWSLQPWGLEDKRFAGVKLCYCTQLLSL